MNNELTQIRNKIHTIRGVQVMFDSDLADLYEVPVKVLNQAVKRNKERFPEDFMFQLTVAEYNSLRSQNVTLEPEHNLRSQNVTSKSEQNLGFQFGTSNWGGRRTLPYAFTEQGVASLSGVLRSKKAVEVNLQIMRAFVTMRGFISKNVELFRIIQSIPSPKANAFKLWLARVGYERVQEIENPELGQDTYSKTQSLNIST